MFVPCLYLGILEHQQGRPSPRPKAREVRARRGNTDFLPPDLFVLAGAGLDGVTLGASS